MYARGGVQRRVGRVEEEEGCAWVGERKEEMMEKAEKHVQIKKTYIFGMKQWCSCTYITLIYSADLCLTVKRFAGDYQKNVSFPFSSSLSSLFFSFYWSWHLFSVPLITPIVSAAAIPPLYHFSCSSASSLSSNQPHSPHNPLLTGRISVSHHLIFSLYLWITASSMTHRSPSGYASICQLLRVFSPSSCRCCVWEALVWICALRNSSSRPLVTQSEHLLTCNFC